MRRHRWTENSGTTDVCTQCGVVRFWESARGPSRRDGEVVAWSVRLTSKRLKAPPDCDGNTDRAPAWAREVAP